MKMNAWTGRTDGIDGSDKWDGSTILPRRDWVIPSQNSQPELAILEAEREEERSEGYGGEGFVRGRREGGVICLLSYLYDRQCFPTGWPPLM